MKSQYCKQILTITIILFSVFQVKANRIRERKGLSKCIEKTTKLIHEDCEEILSHRQCAEKKALITLKKLQIMKETEANLVIPKEVLAAESTLNAHLSEKSHEHNDIRKMIKKLSKCQKKLSLHLIIKPTPQEEEDINKTIETGKGLIEKFKQCTSEIQDEADLMMDFICTAIEMNMKVFSITRMYLASYAKVGYTLPRVLNYIFYGLKDEDLEKDEVIEQVKEEGCLYLTFFKREDICNILSKLKDANKKPLNEQITYNSLVLDFLETKLAGEATRYEIEHYLEFIETLAQSTNIEDVKLPLFFKVKAQGDRETLFTMVHEILMNGKGPIRSHDILSRLKEYIDKITEKNISKRLIRILNTYENLEKRNNLERLEYAIKKYAPGIISICHELDCTV